MVLAVLQSLAQGEGCWGEQGMRNLWDASNVKIFAGGLVRLRLARSYSPYSWERPSMKRKSLTRSPDSWSTQRHRAVSVDELAAIPAGRAVVSLSGTRPVIVQTVPWMRRPNASVVEGSLVRYDGHLGPSLPQPDGAALGKPR